jgi:hypothetical protein
MANIRWAATVAALQEETGMANGEAAILAGYFSVADGGEASSGSVRSLRRAGRSPGRSVTRSKSPPRPPTASRRGNVS